MLSHFIDAAWAVASAWLPLGYAKGGLIAFQLKEPKHQPLTLAVDFLDKLRVKLWFQMAAVYIWAFLLLDFLMILLFLETVRI